MCPVNDLSCARLLTVGKQAFFLPVRKWVAVALLALYMLCSSWVLLMHHPFSGNTPARHSTILTSALAGELEMFEVVRPEEGAANGVIAFRLLNGAVAPSDINISYVVNATVTSPAVNGVDYATLSGTITLGAGSSEVLLDIAVTDDQLIEGEENLEFTLLSAVDQGGDSYLNPNRTLTTKVVDNDNRISITKTADGRELGAGTASDGSFLLKLPGALTFNENILVKYTIDGISTATGGTGAGYDFDNTAVTGEIILPANTNSIPLPVKVNDDQLVEANETVQITIQDNNLSDVTGMKFTFDRAQATASMIIEDDDNIPVNILGATDGREPGGTGNNGSITIGWPNGISATGAVIIRFTITGTASGSADYTAIPVTRVLPAGASNVTIPVSVLNDFIVEGNETVTLTITALTPGAGVPPLLIGPNNTATVTIADDDVMSSLQWKSAGYSGTGAGGAVTAGDQVTYTIHVRNTGNVSLTNVKITDQLPAHTTFISADEGITPDATGTLTWTIPAIAAGAVDITRNFTVRVVQDLTNVTNIVNTAYVNNGDGTGDHPTTPPDPGNPNNPHPGPHNPGDPSTDIPVDNGGKKSANWKSAAYTGTGANGTVKPGDLITYTVHVRNTGHVRLANVVINDTIPAYTAFVSADEGIVPDAAGKLSWTIADIPVGSADVTRNFVVRVINDLTGATGIINTAGIDNGNGSGEQPSRPPDPGNPNNPHPGPDPGGPSTNVPVDNIKRSVNWKSASYTGTGRDGAVKSGDEITYTVHIRNTGYVKLTNVLITDTIPAFTEFVSAEGGIRPDAAGKLSWNIPEIVVGAADLTRTFTVRVVNDLTNAVTIVNTAWVDNGDGSGDHPTSPPVTGNPNQPHPNPDPNDPSTEVPVDNGKSSINWKSAAYTGTGEAGSVTTGDQITYTIHIRNNGNAALSNVLITDNVPAYTEFVSAEDGIVPDGTGKLTWTIAAIPVGAPDITRSYVVRVAADLTGATNIINTAGVDNGTGNKPTIPPAPGNPNEPHTHPDPNDPSTSIPVDTIIRFDAWKTVVTESGNVKAKPGEMLTYTISLRNTGNVVIPSVRITDPVPDHTTFVSATNGGAHDQGTNVVSWTVANLAVGATGTVTFRVKVDADLDSVPVIMNTAMVTDGNVNKPTSGCDPASAGCDGRPGTSIETMPANDGLFFVNAISPNGDGKNEYFIIKGLEKLGSASLYVFNRWGSMVYQAADYHNDWNGSGLSEGTYYYKLELKQAEGTKLYKGWVVIKRK
jgi:uncharacterized repeat protein (TIGR01451 family)/gliding motility-associated-like protein